LDHGNTIIPAKKKSEDCTFAPFTADGGGGGDDGHAGGRTRKNVTVMVAQQRHSFWVFLPRSAYVLIITRPATATAPTVTTTTTKIGYLVL